MGVHRVKVWTACIAGLFLTACSWVQLTPVGEDVRVLEPSAVVNCTKVGKTTVRTAAKVAGLVRHEEKIQSELDILARNSAPEIGGDTVVPLGRPVDGVQVYEAYRCMP